MNEVKTSRKGKYLFIVVAVLALAAMACVCGGGAGAETPVPSTTTTGGTTTGGTTTGSTEPTPAAGDTTGGTTTGGTTTGGTTTGGTTTGGTTTGGTTDAGTTTGSADQTDLEIINNTDQSICYVYIAPSDNDTDWGDEVLGSDVVIGPGATDVVSGPPGVYDIILEDCDHNVIAWNYGADLTSSTNLTVSGSPDTLTVINNSTFDICNIYISSPNSSNWGRSHLNPEHPITQGVTRTFAVTSGVWDLKAVTCDGQEVERLGEELGGDYEWEFYNE